MKHQLTKHKEGSVKEVWTLAYPMILAFLSGNFMIFADRLFLANYSMAAMNAATAAGIVVAIFQCGTATITSIAEVFVAQFNGSGEYKKVATATWQMLWFSLIVFVLFFALAQWGGPYLLPDYYYQEHGLPYYQFLLYFGAATPAIGALSSFFIGIGKTRPVMIITIAGNCLNIILDVPLIFGVNGLIAPMGTKGAAIATGISLLAQCAAFGIIFLQKKYQDKYGTAIWKLDPSLFLRCLKIGGPNAIAHMIDWTAWAISIRMMAIAGEHYLTIATIGQSIYMLVAFGFDGVQKAVTTLSANYIGAKKMDLIWPVWRSGIKLLFISAIPFGIIMLIYPDPIIAEFLSTEAPPSDVVLMTSLLHATTAAIFLYYLFDGFTWICVGILIAAEDTWFVMWVHAITALIFNLAPILLLMVYLQWSPAWYFFIISFYGACNAWIFYQRFINYAKKPVWIKTG